MSSDMISGGDELQLEVIPETESTDGTQDSGNAEGELTEEIRLETGEEEVKLSPQEENAKHQEDVWLNKVIAGKANVEDAPSWLQKRLTARLDATGKVPETAEVVKKVLTQERQAQEFQDLQKQIPPLTQTQAKELQEKFAKYKPLGNVEALKTALELMGISSKVKEAEARGIAKGRLTFPKSGQPSVKRSGQVVGGVPLDVINDDKKWNEMIRTGARA